MQLTPEQLRQNAAAMIAFADGKPIQIRIINSNHEWQTCGQPGWVFESTEYRPRPEPKTRPWTYYDVPPLCWLRMKGNNFVALVTGISQNGFLITYEDRVMLSEIEAYEYSTDLKTFSPCEVTE